jgi:hypothetical protein
MSYSVSDTTVQYMEGRYTGEFRVAGSLLDEFAEGPSIGRGGIPAVRSEP